MLLSVDRGIIDFLENRMQIAFAVIVIMVLGCAAFLVNRAIKKYRDSCQPVPPVKPQPQDVVGTVWVQNQSNPFSPEFAKITKAVLDYNGDMYIKCTRCDKEGVLLDTNEHTYHFPLFENQHYPIEEWHEPVIHAMDDSDKKKSKINVDFEL